MYEFMSYTGYTRRNTRFVFLWMRNKRINPNINLEYVRCHVTYRVH